MRVFVAGGTGVIGRRVLPQLVAAGHHVTASVRSDSKAATLSVYGATPVVVDLFDAPAVRRAVGNADVIINMTTSIPPSSGALLPGAWRETGRVRREISRNLHDAALAGGVTRMIQESFAPIYADGGAQWIHETSAVRPARYNRAVMDAEDVAQR